MKKTLSFLFIMYFVSLLAVHNQFPIGLYSCLRSTNYITLIEKAENANMNMVGIRYNQIGAANFWDAVDLADSKQMDVRIYDDIEFADGGTYHLGGCNHFWYDAENSRSDNLSSYYDVCPEYWFYGLRALYDSTGICIDEDEAYGDPLRDDYPATAHKAWYCSETAGNQPGWAVQYLAYKEEPFHSVSSQVHIPSGIDPDDIYFYFDFALKFSNLPNQPHPASDEVCRLEAVVRGIYDQNIYQYDSQVTLHPVVGANYDHILTVGELEANDTSPEYTRYQFYAKWDEDFPNDILMSSNRIAYIAFRIWWFGVGELKIDGMQIEDNLFRQLENGDYDTAISTRMNQYNGYDNINHFYSYDEPQPPQYRSFKNIQDNIQNHSLATAVMRHDQYARYKIFDYLAEPDLFMEDFYPIGPGLTWNAVILSPHFSVEKAKNLLGNREGVYITDKFIPAPKVNAMADVTVSHGGQGTLQTAIHAGTPIVGVAAQQEQFINLSNIESRGAGIRIPLSKWHTENIQKSISEILSDKKYKQSMLRLRDNIITIDGAKNAATAIWNKIKQKCVLKNEIHP